MTESVEPINRPALEEWLRQARAMLKAGDHTLVYVRVCQLLKDIEQGRPSAVLKPKAYTMGRVP